MYLQEKFLRVFLSEISVKTTWETESISLKWDYVLLIKIRYSLQKLNECQVYRRHHDPV